MFLETIAKQELWRVVEKNKIFFSAFTLAEVLIVLGIIGLIADMMIPTLISSTQEKVTVSKLKKTYSTLENAFRLAVNENGTPDTWEVSSVGKYLNPFDVMGKYMNISKDCKNNKGCFPDVMYKLLGSNSYWGNWDENEDTGRVRLSDGVLIAGAIEHKDCAWVAGTSQALKNNCGTFAVDTNGFKEPNTIGKDMFYFRITKLGIIPWGTQQDTVYSFDKYCLGVSNGKGWGCTAWVIYNENMDYLHCDGLSWDGKKSCKGSP